MSASAVNRGSPIRKANLASARRKTPKQSGPSKCPDCGVVFKAGRWVWQTAPEGAHSLRCPACVRVAGGSPAGYVSLSGAFFDAHRAEIVRLMRNTEASEKSRHPMERIMTMAETRNGLRITTTGIHLARRMGDALCDAYSGTLGVSYLKGDQVVRVTWDR